MSTIKIRKKILLIFLKNIGKIYGTCIVKFKLLPLAWSLMHEHGVDGDIELPLNAIYDKWKWIQSPNGRLITFAINQNS